MSTEYMWGCELSSENPEYEWLADDCKRGLNFSILLKHAMLDPKANSKDIHVIDLETVGIDLQSIRQPLFMLKSGVIQQIHLDMLINHVGSKLILTSGEGPVYLWGQQIVELDDRCSGSDVEELDLDKVVEHSGDEKSLVNDDLETSPNPRSTKSANTVENEDYYECSETAEKEINGSSGKSIENQAKSKKAGPKRSKKSRGGRKSD